MNDSLSSSSRPQTLYKADKPTLIDAGLTWNLFLRKRTIFLPPIFRQRLIASNDFLAGSACADNTNINCFKCCSRVVSLQKFQVKVIYEITGDLLFRATMRSYLPGAWAISLLSSIWQKQQIRESLPMPRSPVTEIYSACNAPISW